MAWNSNWHYITGDVRVTVRAKDENERFQKFDFTAYVSEEVDSYDRLDNLSDVAHHMAYIAIISYRNNKTKDRPRAVILAERS